MNIEDKLRHYAVRLTLLNTLGQHIAAELDMDRVMSQAVYLVQESFGYDLAALWILDAAHDQLVLQAVAGSWATLFPPERQIAVGQGLIGQVAEHGQQQLVISSEPHQAAHAELVMPIHIGNELAGVLDLQSRDPDAFDEADILAIETLSDQIAIAIKNARLYAALTQERAGLAQRVQERTAELSLANAHLARAARLKDEFLTNMSHELRTPLNAILGLSEAILEGAYGPPTQEQVEPLRNIGQAGRHLLALVNDTLDIARAEAGKIDLQIEPFPVGTLCQASLGLVQQMARQKNIQIALHIDDTVEVIQGDERRLRQVLVNLLSNAIKFTPMGGQVGLEVTGDRAGETVYLTVWDSGIGIAQEDMGQLFQPFVQLNGGLSKQYAGSGLGLALVRRLVELHCGSVTVQSQVGQGSRFIVSLPWRDTAEASKTPLPPDRERASLATATQGLILLAEDNPIHITTIRHGLLSQGYQVSVACNGLEAIRLAREQTPDLILMDLQMPEMDGLTAIRRLREHPEFANVPIIAITALSMPDDQEQCLEAGADEYISKPVGMGQLQRIVQAHLGPR